MPRYTMPDTCHTPKIYEQVFELDELRQVVRTAVTRVGGRANNKAAHV